MCGEDRGFSLKTLINLGSWDIVGGRKNIWIYVYTLRS